MHTSVQFWAGARWRKADITQRRVGTSQDQQSPRCYSWLFPGWDLQPWVTCPAETHGDGESEVRGVQRTRLLSDILHICVHWSAASRLTNYTESSSRTVSLSITWKTSVWLGLGCVCCSPVCWEWCWFCHWDQTSLGRPWNWAPLWLLSPDTSENTFIYSWKHFWQILWCTKYLE